MYLTKGDIFKYATKKELKILKEIYSAELISILKKLTNNTEKFFNFLEKIKIKLAEKGLKDKPIYIKLINMEEYFKKNRHNLNLLFKNLETTDKATFNNFFTTLAIHLTPKDLRDIL
ncbi:MAG: hypothetical protein N2114_06045 [Candidatus Goldbacteria bacterium]|nr:hypothetical protein [Candidatus Goldiibacteriota bacterium]